MQARRHKVSTRIISAKLSLGYFEFMRAKAISHPYEVHLLFEPLRHRSLLYDSLSGLENEVLITLAEISNHIIAQRLLQAKADLEIRPK